MIFRHRRTFCFCLFFICAAFLAYGIAAFAWEALLFAVLPSALLSFLLSLFLSKKLFRTLTVLLLLLAFTLIPNAIHEEPMKAIGDCGTEEIEVVLNVIEIESNNTSSTLARAKLISLRGKKCDATVTVRFSDITPKAGDTVRATATIRAVEKTDYSATQGIHATVDAKDAKCVDSFSHPTLLFSSLRASLAARIRVLVPAEEAELICTLLLGVRDGLSDSFRTDMTRLGTAHMLALSGLHLSILVLGADKFLRMLRLHATARRIVVALLAAFFMALTGFSSSVMRAAFMLLLATATRLLRMEHDSLSSLSMAVAVILLFEPYAVMDVALWLSALSTLGILLLLEQQSSPNEKQKLLRSILRAVSFSVSVTVAATVATLPLTVYLYGTLPLLSPIANLLLSLPVQAILYLSVLLLILGGILPFLGKLVGTLCSFFMRFSDELASIDGTVLSVRGAAETAILGVFFLLLTSYFIFCPRKAFRFRVPVALFLLLCVTLSSFLGLRYLWQKDKLHVTYVTAENVEADLLFLRENGTHTLFLCTDGEKEESRFIRDAISAHSPEGLDALVVPAYSESAVDCLKALLTQTYIGHLYLPVPQSQTEASLASSLFEEAGKEHTACSYLTADRPYQMQNTRISILERNCASGNTYTVICSVSHGEERLLYTSSHSLFLDPTPALERSNAIVFGSFGRSYANPPFEHPSSLGAPLLLCGNSNAAPTELYDGILFVSEYSFFLN